MPPLLTSEWTARTHLPREQFIIQAHRGGGEHVPENTLPAFELAWSLGTYPEADIRTTRDGVIVAFHDKDFSRVVSGASEELKRKGVPDVTWAELSQFDVGAFRGSRFAGQRVLPMADAFRAMHRRPERALYLDIKNVVLADFARLVHEHGVAAQVIFASSDYTQIRQWKFLAPTSGTLLWIGGGPANQTARIASLRPSRFADLTQIQLHVNVKPEANLSQPDAFEQTDSFLIDTGRELRAHGVTFQVFPWLTPRSDVYPRLLDLGVMSFATDHPELALTEVNRYYARP